MKMKTRVKIMGLACLVIWAASSAMINAAPRGSEMKVSAKVESPSIIAVRIRHDMCPYCQKFDPEFPKLIRKTQGQSVLFITLDLTSEETQKQAALLVGALGLQSVWTGDLSKIGTMTFIETKSKRLISSIHATDVMTVLQALLKAIDQT